MSSAVSTQHLVSATSSYLSHASSTITAPLQFPTTCQESISRVLEPYLLALNRSVEEVKLKQDGIYQDIELLLPIEDEQPLLVARAVEYEILSRSNSWSIGPNTNFARFLDKKTKEPGGFNPIESWHTPRLLEQPSGIAEFIRIAHRYQLTKLYQELIGFLDDYLHQVQISDLLDAWELVRTSPQLTSINRNEKMDILVKRVFSWFFDRSNDATELKQLKPLIESHLHSLVLSDGNLTDEVLRKMLECSKSLEILEIRTQGAIKGEEIALIDSPLENLKCLKLNSCPLLTAAGLKALLQKCPKLEHLDINNCSGISSNELENLPDLPKLDTLTIRGKHELKLKLSNKYAETIKNLTFYIVPPDEILID